MKTILEYIDEYVKECEEKNKEPKILPLLELQKRVIRDMRADLNQLFREGKIKARQLLNDKGIERNSDRHII